MTWLIAFGVMLLVVAGMAVGVMAGRKPIAGSCGGLSVLGENEECAFCGGKRENCKRQQHDHDD